MKYPCYSPVYETFITEKDIKTADDNLALYGAFIEVYIGSSYHLSGGGQYGLQQDWEVNLDSSQRKKDDTKRCC